MISLHLESHKAVKCIYATVFLRRLIFDPSLGLYASHMNFLFVPRREFWLSRKRLYANRREFWLTRKRLVAPLRESWLPWKRWDRRKKKFSCTQPTIEWLLRWSQTISGKLETELFANNFSINAKTGWLWNLNGLRWLPRVITNIVLIERELENET